MPEAGAGSASLPGTRNFLALPTANRPHTGVKQGRDVAQRMVSGPELVLH